ncbi:transposable element Tcb2 transposase [Trichonephila clavipes]|nr:transposable element Tcb2 transposase [Trichonephila clavipes]
MSSRHHIDDFMRGQIIGKIEEGRKITDVAREFDIRHSVVSRLWKSFKTTGMCSRQHGGGRVRKNIQENDRYPTCSIMVWTGIMINGRTRLHVVAHGTMTGQRYIDEVLLPHVCLDSEGIQRLVWPARSPDLNPIENVRDALGRQVAGQNYPPTNKNTLIRALTEEWDKLPQQLLDNVVQSMGSSESVQEFAARINKLGTQIFQSGNTASHVDLSTRATKQHHYEYKIGSLCFIKTPNIKSNLSPKLRPKFEGPYRVIKRFSNVNYRVQHVEQLRKRFNTHVNRMIPFIKRFSYLHLNNLDDLQPDETEVKGIVPSSRYNLRARAGNSAH